MFGGMPMKKRTKMILIGMVLGTVLLNIIAWTSKDFCDFYVENVFPIWLYTYGRLTSLFSFSVGEVMIVILCVLLVAAAILGIFACAFLIWDKGSKKGQNHFKRFLSIYFNGLLCLGCGVFFIMTLNCFILYHCSTFEEKYMTSYIDGTREYSVEELAQVRDFVVMQVNRYAKMMERDENGLICYEGNMEEEAIRSMQNLAVQYPQLAGYYPMPKKIRASEFLSQQYMQGYYFPFSMEANYNDVMYVMCKPATICHELAHTKGFIYEDEANLLGFLACIHSDDIVFQYSGYLSVLTYIDNDFKESIHQDKTVYNSHVKISSQVKKDRVFLTEDAWTKVEQKAVVKTETVKKVSSQLIDANLVLNGIEQGKANYCEVVGLIMDYYAGPEGDFKSEEYMVMGE